MNYYPVCPKQILTFSFFLNMKIKTKLSFSFGLLMGLITILGIVSCRYIYIMKGDTENILQDNYMTLQFANQMLYSLDLPERNKAIQNFEINLKKQVNNITEPGERELTNSLQAEFDNYKKEAYNEASKLQLRSDLLQIMELNMKAIHAKNNVAKRSANNALNWIYVTSVLCFLIALIILFNFPSEIANPILKLRESILQISAKNYSSRLYFDPKSEFGLLSETFNRMAEKLQEYDRSNLAEILFEKKRIEALINNISDPVIGLDEHQRVIFINPEALRILNLPEEASLNHLVSEIASSNDLVQSLADDLDVVAPSQQQQPVKIFIDEKECYFEKKISRILVETEKEAAIRLVGYVIILRNVTQYKEIDFAKTNFIAAVSHELKTPISSIILSTQLLSNERVGELNTEQSQLLSSIQDDTKRLLNITGELLKITQIESGNIQLSILLVDVRELIAYAVNALKTQADEKQIKIQVDYPESALNVQADSEKTAWVLTNLISNAIRYSSENSTINIGTKRVNDKVFISVKDSGIGIAPEYKDKIFNRYFRIPGTKKEGNGLGLSISKEFIEAQGGQITMQSEIGEGSTFVVALRL